MKFRKKLSSKSKTRVERNNRPSIPSRPSDTQNETSSESSSRPTGSTQGFPSHLTAGDNCSPSLDETENNTEMRRHRGSSRSTNTISTFGNLSLSPPAINRSPSRPRQNNPLGLSVLWNPELNRTLDIVLVHGLGGTSQSTWSKNHDPEYFWPRLWLPSEPVIRSARILSFGYDADWRSTGSKTQLNITDFAKELLFAMKFAKDEENDLEDLSLGDVPIIFIVHSMGGLVVKKAYILGQSDEEYQDVIKSISAIIFLSTPHRGSNLAELLNRILSASILRYSPKQYIADLQKNSPALEELNEQFRKVAPKLHIVSFYETLETVVGPKKLMVLEKESAILGYPGEISRAMYADHHNVCKYESTRDSNYISIRNVLKTLVDRLHAIGQGLRRPSSDDMSVENVLSITDRPDDDYNFFRDRWMPNTCEWILEETSFQNWLHQPSPESSVLWLHGLPASGKSILSSFIINHIKEMGKLCHFHFLRFNESSKRSINGLLRSIAFQASQDIPNFRRYLRDLSEDGLRLEKAEARLIWNRLFVASLLAQREKITLYWVIDALDEASTPQLLLDLFAGLRKSQVAVRLLIVSRETHALSLGFDQLCNEISVQSLPITEQSSDDIRLYVENRMQFSRWGPSFKEEISEKLLSRADGNFLWVHLAIREIMRRHTVDDIRQALEYMPTGMEAMYHRMASDMAKVTGPMDRALASRILAWAMYSRKPLTLRQLSEALRPQFNQIPDLRSTIPDICGFFVVVDINDHVTMIHQTARDYFTKTPDLELSIDAETVHHELFGHCMGYLMDSSIRTKFGQTSLELKRDFIHYAATSWPYHLSMMPKYPASVVTTLIQFLRGPSILAWIHALALLRELKVLVYASKYLGELAGPKRQSRIENGLDTHHNDLLRAWSTDLIKLAGKFGATLVTDPSSITRFIPDLCPQSSMLYRQFTKQKSLRSISVAGITNQDWDDSVAHISIRRYQTSRILCSRRYIAAIVTSPETKGLTIVWNSLNFDKEASLVQGEYITASCFNSSGTKYVACGVSKTKIWEIPSGRLLVETKSPEDTAILGLIFNEEKNALLAASDDKMVRMLSLDEFDPQWRPLFSLKESEVDGLGYANSPCAMVFDEDATRIAIAYRGFPLSVWSIEEHQVVGRCLRQVDGLGFSNTTWSSVDTLSWNQKYGTILGKYNDGCIFKWDPYEDMSHELRTPASIVQCSPDGLSFATCDNHGIIRLFNYQTFHMIYQLRCHTTTKAFAFAPDSRRFYEVRDTVCTAWEPPALAELQDSGDHLDELWDTESASSATLVDLGQVVEQADPTTALAVTVNGRFFCTGNESGEVVLYHKDAKRIMDVWVSQRLLTTDFIVWDNDGRHLGIVELGGDVIIKHLQPPVSNETTQPWEIKSVVDVKISPELCGVRQLLFSRTDGHLLLVGQSSVQVWSLADRRMIAGCSEGIESGTNWMNDPHDGQLLLAFDHHGVRRFSWKNLQATNLVPYQMEPKMTIKKSTMESSLQDFFRIDAKLTQDQSHVVVRLTSNTGSSKCIIINISDLKSIPRPGSEGSQMDATVLILHVMHLPESIASSVEMPLGVLPRKRFAYLDQEFWVCTWKMDSDITPSKSLPSIHGSGSAQVSKLKGVDSVKRHFTLPRDWINEDNLPLLQLANDGTLFCPKGGEVAVIATRLAMAW